jgi:hypothetical protein
MDDLLHDNDKMTFIAAIQIYTTIIVLNTFFAETQQQSDPYTHTHTTVSSSKTGATCEAVAERSGAFGWSVGAPPPFFTASHHDG